MEKLYVVVRSGGTSMNLILGNLKGVEYAGTSINDLLITNSTRNGIRGVGKMPQNDKLKSKENPEGLIGLYESKYHGMSAEQIYDELIKEFPPMPQSFGMGGQDDDQQQNGDSGNDQDQSNSNGKGQSGGSSNMAPNGSGQRLLDSITKSKNKRLVNC